jgi:hypothetical protein
MFGKWDVERAVLMGMLLLILAGLVFIVYERNETQTLAAGMSSAEKQLAQIGSITEEVRVLQDEITNDAVASGKLDSYAYIERQLVETRVGKTAFSIGQPKVDRHENEGYEDTSYPLTQAPQSRDSFKREEIGMFLLYIEGNTTRMKATRIKLDRSTKAAAEEDAWKAGLTITDRRPIGKS